MKLSSRLSRSAIDATRFTATSPHAYSKPTRTIPSSTSSSPSNTRANTQPHRIPNPNAPKRSPPPGSAAKPRETPAEKVARLRAARIAEREAQATTWDRVVVRGRSWADRAHKVTVYTLVAFSVVAAGITAFALSDMILHNRRKRSAFYAEQRSLYATRLLDAIETERSGLPLDEDQTLILNRERARVQAEEAKKARSWGKSIKGILTGGLKAEEGVELPVVPTEGEILEKIGVSQAKVLEAADGLREGELDGGPGVDENDRLRLGETRMDGGGILQAVEEKRREGERVMEASGVRGGSLDRVAEQAVEKAKAKGNWFNWGR